MSKYVKQYDDDFKKQSVKLLVQSGKPLKVLARELGVSDTALREWRNFYRKSDLKLSLVKTDKSSRKDLEREVARLNKENDYLKRQREILKKAMSIVSEEPTEGML